MVSEARFLINLILLIRSCAVMHDKSFDKNATKRRRRSNLKSSCQNILYRPYVGKPKMQHGIFNLYSFSLGWMQTALRQAFSYGIRHVFIVIQWTVTHSSGNHNEKCRIPYENAWRTGFRKLSIDSPCSYTYAVSWYDYYISESLDPSLWFITWTTFWIYQTWNSAISLPSSYVSASYQCYSTS